MLIKNQIALRHELVALWDEARVVSVLAAKMLKFFIEDGEFPRVTLRLFRIILPFDKQDLEALPPIWVQLGDVAVHVFLPVVSIDHRVELEQHTVCPTPVGDPV